MKMWHQFRNACGWMYGKPGLWIVTNLLWNTLPCHERSEKLSEGAFRYRAQRKLHDVLLPILNPERIVKVTDNLLLNPSFELGWTDDGNRQIPNHWDFWYAPPNCLNWVDPSDGAKFSDPEMRHLTRDDLPPDEHSLFFFDDSNTTLKIFAPKWRTAYCSLVQSVNVVKGYTYKLTVNLNPDIVDHYEGGVKVPAPDPNSGQMLFIVDNTLDWFTMQPFLTPQVFTYEFVASVTGAIDIGAEWVFPHPLTGGSAIFTDAWELVVVGEPVEPDPCRGTPRVQYPRIYNVIPQDATRDRAHEIFDLAFDDKQTVGFSSDDAGLGDLNDKTAIEWDRTEEQKPDYEEFYNVHYTGTKIRFEGTTDPTTPPPAPFMLPTYHMQRPFTNWIEEIERVAVAGKPLKWVFIVHEGMENIQLVREKSPTTKGVYRLVISQGEQGALLNNPDAYAAALSYWKRFSDSALTTHIDAVCSINETIGTGPAAADERRRTVRFDAAFAEVVAQESHGEIAPVTLLAPPGNPDHGIETEELIPAVIATATANGYLGPHTYFPCHPNPGVSERWMETEGLHYHLRPLLSWYPTFRNAGITDLPPLLLLETGAVGGYLRDDGRPGGFITSGMGWRDAGCLEDNLPRYLGLLTTYVEQLEMFDFVECCAIFTQGMVGWDKFQFNREFGQLFDLLLE